MASKLRERARKIRENLFKIFCVCSAGTFVTDDGEAPHQQEGRGRLRFVTGRQLDKAMAELHESQVALTPFEMRLPSEQISVPREPQELFARQENVPRQQCYLSHQELFAACKQETVPHHQETTHQHVPVTRQQVSIPHQQVPRPPQQFSAPRQRVAASHQHQSRDGESRGAVVQAEMASLLQQVTGGAGASSIPIHEIQEMFEFIERALTFRRRDLPVFELSRSPVARPPIFAPRPAWRS